MCEIKINEYKYDSGSARVNLTKKYITINLKKKNDISKLKKNVDALNTAINNGIGYACEEIRIIIDDFIYDTCIFDKSDEDKLYFKYHHSYEV